MSHVHGSTTELMPGMTIGQAMSRAAAQWPDMAALISSAQGIQLTWEELDRVSARCAASMLESGMQPGDRVGLWAMNCAEWVIVQIAVARAGMILVTINPAYRIAELRRALASTNCTALFVGAAYKSSDFVAMLDEIRAQERADESSTALLPDLVIAFDGADAGEFLAWERFLTSATPDAHARLSALASSIEENWPVNIQFTSGTTGSPKGVVLTHRNIMTNGWFTGRALGIVRGDRLCLPVPLYHCFGMVTGVLVCLAHGATIVLPAPVFDPTATLAAITENRCTAFYGVPTMYVALFRHPAFDESAMSSLRTGIMAGSLCPEPLVQDAIDRMHMRDLAICYGMTEAPVSFQTASDDPLPRRLRSVGKIQPHIEAKVIDDAGAIVPRNHTGEICVRGYNTMQGYWNDLLSSAETKDADGWVHTGDLGAIDDEGYLQIVGRLKDMVIRGGENLYPKEIEEFLIRHPDIADVQVFGVPDTVFGEELCAWIVPNSGSTIDEDAVRVYCQGQIAHHKVPRHMRFVTDFPMTVTGKVQKSVLREAMIREFAASPIT